MIIKQNIRIKTDLENSIQKLKTVPVQEWKDTITDLLDQNSAFDTLEQVLDIISPIKSPVKFEASWEDVEIQGYSLSSRILGEGQNKVRLATHQKTKQIVAVKCIDRIKLKKDKISCTGVVRELLVWGSLKHPHICPLLEVIDSVDSIYMVMEYQPGGDLFSYLEKGRLPEQKACFLFRQIIQGIQYCHSQSVVHRDLKPENIVFDSQGNIKICDFGFSNMIKKNVGFVEFCGSPEYAAPEMIARKPYAGPEVDIWSIGVILYVMVTATMPFGETNVSRLFVSIMMGKYSIPDYVSASCKSLISSILKPQPSQRATLESIRVHEWTNQNGQSLLQFVDETVRNPSEYLASSTKDELKKMGFSDSDIQEYLEKESPGPIKAAVFLIRQASRPRKMPQLEVPVHIEARPPTIVTKYTQSNNLFAQIRKERSIAPKTAPYIITDRPPVISTTQHRFNIQQTQLLILRNLKHLGGHISEFDDENPNTLYGSLKIKERSMFGDHSDPEIAACFQGDQMEMLFSAVGDQLGINEFQTKFELLNGYDKEWVFEEFDKIVNQLLRGVS